jgi:hypothetical protein
LVYVIRKDCLVHKASVRERKRETGADLLDMSVEKCLFCLVVLLGHDAVVLQLLEAG